MLMCCAVRGSPTTFSIVNGCYCNFMRFLGSLVSPLIDLSERVNLSLNRCHSFDT